MSKRTRTSHVPKIGKIPRKVEDVESLAFKNFRWKINKHYMDLYHEEWGWDKLGILDFFDIIIDRFNDYETMTWQDISKRKNCHPMPVQDICGKAQSRLWDMQKDIDMLYQVDISEIGRIFGYRERALFYLIWHDPAHTVCPFNK